MQNVIVIGPDHHNTLGVVESLGMAGISPFVIITTRKKPSKCFVLRSKYCQDKSFTASYSNLIDLLYANFKENSREKYVVITTNDQTAALLDNNYTELSQFLLLPGTDKQGELEYWMDKLHMINLAKTVGMNVPETITVKRGEMVDDFVFPCITKSVSTLKGGKINIKICKDLESLNRFLSKQTQYDEIQVQRFIDKDFEFQFIGCSINNGEEIIIPGRTHIDRPNGYDNNFHKLFIQNDSSFDKVLSQTKNFIRQTRYSGLFSVEFLRDKNGVDFFLEMNFRNDGGAICVTASGTNLPYLWYLSNVNKNAYKQALTSSTFTPVVYTPAVHYFYNMAHGEVTFREWWQNNRKTTQFSTYFKDDTAPFWCHLWLHRIRIMRSIAFKIFKSGKH